MARPMWVRVKDRDTRHEYDVPEGDPRIGKTVDMVKAKRYPPSPLVRPAKHHVKLAGQSASRQQSAPDGSAEKANDKEN